MMFARPQVYRVARVLQLLATVGIVAIAAFVATLGYSAAQIHPEYGGPVGSRMVGDNAVQVTVDVNVSNQGLYPVQGLAAQVSVYLDNGSTVLVASGSSPRVTAPAGSVTSIPFSATIPLGLEAGEFLLTHDAQLPTILSANATYGFLFDIHLHSVQNLTWGAPFYGLTITLGAVTSASNGSRSVPVTVAFANHARFPIDGQISFDVKNPARAVCGTGTFSPEVPPGGSDRATTVTWLAPGCSPVHGAITSVYRAPAWTIPLPVQGIP